MNVNQVLKAKKRNKNKTLNFKKQKINNKEVFNVRIKE